MTRRSLLGGMVTAIAAMARPSFARQAASFRGRKAGDERKVDAIDLCWCPAGRFVMGSPRSEPERRPGEDQVEVTLTRGFWMATFETTQACRSAFRVRFEPDRRYDHIGFRVVVVERG